MNTLDNDHVVKDLPAELLFLFRCRVMHLVSELLRCQLEKLGDT